MSASSLSRFADAAEIEPRCWDIHGRLHERSTETARQLLRAMQVPASTDAEVATSLAMLTDEPWHEVLPSVVIVTERRKIEVPFRLPVNPTGGYVRWSIEHETGEHESGECLLDYLPI